MLKENSISKVAVIMSVYHKDEPIALRESLQSMINQTYICDMFIFIDGQVSETLMGIIGEFNSTQRVKVFESECNIGLAAALNFLIDQVLVLDYQYIARMDSDDISRPHRIEQQVSFLDKQLLVDVLGTSCREFGASFALEEKHLPEHHQDLVKFSCTRCPFIHPSVMFRADVFRAGFRYPTNTAVTEDMALWFELLKAGYRFSNIKLILLDYRLNEKTISRRQGFKKALSEILLRQRNMFHLKQFSFKNLFFIYARLFFHLMPSSILKFAYKNLR